MPHHRLALTQLCLSATVQANIQLLPLPLPRVTPPDTQADKLVLADETEVEGAGSEFMLNQGVLVQHEHVEVQESSDEFLMGQGMVLTNEPRTGHSLTHCSLSHCALSHCALTVLSLTVLSLCSH